MNEDMDLVVEASKNLELIEKHGISLMYLEG